MAAARVLLEYPDASSHLLSQSGAFWASRFSSLGAERSDEQIIERWEASPHSPRRAYLEVGRYERSHYAEPVESNRRFARVLRAKDCDVRYTEYEGGHDVFYWSGSLADGLVTLLR